MLLINCISILILIITLTNGQTCRDIAKSPMVIDFFNITTDGATNCFFRLKNKALVNAKGSSGKEINNGDYKIRAADQCKREIPGSILPCLRTEEMIKTYFKNHAVNGKVMALLGIKSIVKKGKQMQIVCENDQICKIMNADHFFDKTEQIKGVADGNVYFFDIDKKLIQGHAKNMNQPPRNQLTVYCQYTIEHKLQLKRQKRAIDKCTEPIADKEGDMIEVKDKLGRSHCFYRVKSDIVKTASKSGFDAANETVFKQNLRAECKRQVADGDLPALGESILTNNFFSQISLGAVIPMAMQVHIQTFAGKRNITVDFDHLYETSPLFFTDTNLQGLIKVPGVKIGSSFLYLDIATSFSYMYFDGTDKAYGRTADQLVTNVSSMAVYCHYLKLDKAPLFMTTPKASPPTTTTTAPASTTTGSTNVRAFWALVVIGAISALSISFSKM